MNHSPVAPRLAALAVFTLVLGGIGTASVFAAPASDTPGSNPPQSVAPATAIPASPTAPESIEASVPSVPGMAPSTLPTPSSEPSAQVAPPAPSPIAASNQDELLRPADGGAVMGQAGKMAPQPATTLPRSLSGTSEPQVRDQPPGTQGQPVGLDVSGWQKNVNWTTVKSQGARFAYIKTSEGPWKLNDYFTQQYNGAANVGLLRGGYHFARPNLSSGASQAKVMLSSGGSWTADGKTLPPALDIEDNPYEKTDGTNKCYGMTPAALVSWAKDFTQTIKSSTGKDAVIYSSYYFWNECLGNSTAFADTNPLWIAAYYASSPWMPGKWPQYTFWQYANDFADPAQTIPATFPGDQNVFNGTMAQLRLLATNTHQPTNPTPPPPTVVVPEPKSVIGLIPGATVISGKWGGDGKTYVGWFKDSHWCLEMPGRIRDCFYFGAPGDKPVVGDWDGDGTETIGIFRNGSWQLSNSLSKKTVSIVQYFGVGSDTPITGDWNGDGKTTIGIFRQGSWQVTNSQAKSASVNVVANFGVASDTPVVGDWNGDGWATFGVWRNGTFWLSDSQLRPPVDYVLGFGISSDTPAVGDWDGNRRTTVGIVRGNTWQLTNDLLKRTVDSVRF